MARRKFSLLTFIAALLIIWIGGFALFSATSILRVPQKLDQTTDVIVVLTGGGNRIEEGLRLFATGKAKELFISGVHPDVTENEIRAMWKGGAPIPECCITLERRSLSTLENAVETKNWIKDKNYHSICLVTANYHMNRSLLHFSFLIPEAKIIPHPVKQADMTPRTKKFWLIMLSEYNKMLFRLAVAPYLYIESWLQDTNP